MSSSLIDARLAQLSRSSELQHLNAAESGIVSSYGSHSASIDVPADAAGADADVATLSSDGATPPSSGPDSTSPSLYVWTQCLISRRVSRMIIVLTAAAIMSAVVLVVVGVSRHHSMESSAADVSADELDQCSLPEEYDVSDDPAAFLNSLAAPSVSACNDDAIPSVAAAASASTLVPMEALKRVRAVVAAAREYDQHAATNATPTDSTASDDALIDVPVIENTLETVRLPSSEHSDTAFSTNRGGPTQLDQLAEGSSRSSATLAVPTREIRTLCDPNLKRPAFLLSSDYESVFASFDITPASISSTSPRFDLPSSDCISSAAPNNCLGGEESTTTLHFRRFRSPAHRAAMARAFLPLVDAEATQNLLRMRADAIRLAAKRATVADRASADLMPATMKNNGGAGELDDAYLRDAEADIAETSFFWHNLDINYVLGRTFSAPFLDSYLPTVADEAAAERYLEKRALEAAEAASSNGDTVAASEDTNRQAEIRSLAKAAAARTLATDMWSLCLAQTLTVARSVPVGAAAPSQDFEAAFVPVDAVRHTGAIPDNSARTESDSNTDASLIAPWCAPFVGFLHCGTSDSFDRLEVSAQAVGVSSDDSLHHIFRRTDWLAGVSAALPRGVRERQKREQELAFSDRQAKGEYADLGGAPPHCRPALARAELTALLAWKGRIKEVDAGEEATVRWSKRAWEKGQCPVLVAAMRATK